MRNDVLGIVFSNINDSLLPQLTEERCLGSVPFGGRYRLVDFALSNLVSAGVSNVGIITRSNYRSLMDHIKSGKQWDLARKEGGVFFISPYAFGNGVYQGRLEALMGAEGYIRSNNKKYVVFTDCNYVCNIDIEALVDFHEQSGANITFAYTSGECPDTKHGKLAFTKLAANGKVEEMQLLQKGEVADHSINVFVASTEFILATIAHARSMAYSSIERDVIMRNADKMAVYGYKVNSQVLNIDSVMSYFDSSMQLLKPMVQNDIFGNEHPVLTKVRDEMPAKYGMNAKVKNSLIADGCIIEGEVENCILFREVKVAAGTKLSNCIVMQGSEIDKNVNLSYCIIDKNCRIGSAPFLNGSPSYPLYIKKGSTI